jgi:tripartite-type tricarboxylate transporter receptor subunit TctC
MNPYVGMPTTIRTGRMLERTTKEENRLADLAPKFFPSCDQEGCRLSRRGGVVIPDNEPESRACYKSGSGRSRMNQHSLSTIVRSIRRGMMMAGLFAATTCSPIASAAQALQTKAAPQFPTRPVRMIVGTEAGAAPDILARIVAEKLTDHLGQQVVVDNRPGAAAVLGAEIVSRAPADGYTLMLSAAIHVVTPNVYRKMPYHPIESFTPVAQVASSPFVLVISPRLPVASVKELIAHARANPGKLNFSSPGNGSIQQLSAEMLKQGAGINMTHVPYKSGAAAVTAILTGDVQLCFVGLPPALPHIKAERVRALAVTTAARFPTTPDIPTAQEAGLAGFEADNWHVIFGPARIPRPLVDRLNAEILKVLAREDVKARMLQSGAVAAPSSPQKTRDLMMSELEKWAKAAKAAGIKPER